MSESIKPLIWPEELKKAVLAMLKEYEERDRCVKNLAIEVSVKKANPGIITDLGEKRLRDNLEKLALNCDKISEGIEELCQSSGIPVDHAFAVFNKLYQLQKEANVPASQQKPTGPSLG